MFFLIINDNQTVFITVTPHPHPKPNPSNIVAADSWNNPSVAFNNKPLIQEMSLGVEWSEVIVFSQPSQDYVNHESTQFLDSAISRENMSAQRKLSMTNKVSQVGFEPKSFRMLLYVSWNFRSPPHLDLPLHLDPPSPIFNYLKIFYMLIKCTLFDIKICNKLLK